MMLKRLRPRRDEDTEIRGEASATAPRGGGAPRAFENECPREQEVLDALAAARWPNRVETELTDHVASCEVCQDVITVAAAMREDHEAALDDWNIANVPSSGQMWWRAEMRARQDAIREASRPVMVAQGVAVVAALALAAVAGWFAWPTIAGMFKPESQAQMPMLGSAMFVPIAVAMVAVVMVLAPVALYFVLSDQTD